MKITGRTFLFALAVIPYIFIFCGCSQDKDSQSVSLSRETDTEHAGYSAGSSDYDDGSSVNDSLPDAAQDTVLFGGGMVYGSTLISGDDNTFFSYELPVISPIKIKNMTVSSVHVSGKGNYQIQPDGFSFGNTYKGWYYYYIHLKVKLSQDIPADLVIDHLDLEIDGKKYSYTPYRMAFFNTEGLYREKIPDDEGILLYKDPPAVIRSTIPDDPSEPDILLLEVNEDCTYTGTEALDFLDLTDISYKINEEPYIPENDRIELRKGDLFEISCCLQYQEGLSDSDMIKTSRIIHYEDKDGNPCIMNDPQGYIIIGFEEDRMIRHYIDREILDEE